MRVVVAYDVSTESPQGRARLRRIARACGGYGVRVQYSVFECSLTDKDWIVLRDRLLRILEASEDSLRFYFLSEDDAARTEHHGVREPVDLDGPLIV